MKDKGGVILLFSLAIIGVILLGRRAGAEPLPLPPPEEPPPGAKRSPCPPMGDVDGDGWVTEEDALSIARYLSDKITFALTLEQIARAQVRGEKLAITDALFIEQYLKGLRDTFPICNV